MSEWTPLPQDAKDIEYCIEVAEGVTKMTQHEARRELLVLVSKANLFDKMEERRRNRGRCIRLESKP